MLITSVTVILYTRRRGTMHKTTVWYCPFMKVSCFLFSVVYIIVNSWGIWSILGLNFTNLVYPSCIKYISYNNINLMQSISLLSQYYDSWRDLGSATSIIKVLQGYYGTGKSPNIWQVTIKGLQVFIFTKSVQFLASGAMVKMIQDSS